MRFRHMMSLIVLMISIISNAQVNEYYFKQITSSYTALSSETVLWSGTFDNAVSTIEIPSFTINGTAYTTMTVSTNGFITFGGTAPSSTYYSPIGGTGSYNAAVSAFGENLQNAAAGSPKISYNTNVGGEIVVQWQDVKRVYATPPDVASFQIRLNPSTGLVSIVYGSVTTTYTGTSFGLQVGLRGASNTDFINRTIPADNNWSTSIGGTSYNSTCRFNSSTSPASGLTYTWKPLYNPLNFTLEVIDTNQINVSWQKNSLNHNVMLAYNTTSTFGTPVSGNTYTVGGTIAGGGTVLVYGNATNYQHTGLSKSTGYFYKIWSYDAVPDYSTGDMDSTWTVSTLPYLQDFSGTSLQGWSGDMTPTALHGIAGGKGLTKRLNSGTAIATSPQICKITSTTNLSFHYRIVNYLGYPFNAASLGTSDKMEVQISDDDGATYNTIYTIDQSNHITSTDFAIKTISLSAYNADYIKVRFLCTWASGDYYIDIDHLLVENGNNMSYAGSTVEQINLSNVGINTINNEIVRLQVITQKSSNPISLYSLSLSTGGSGSDADLAATKIFYTTTPVFSTANQFGITVFNPSGGYIISGTQVLAAGNNYFWICYNIKSTAVAGNAVDASCSSFTTSESGTGKVPTVTAPNGNRRIGAVISGTKSIPGDYASVAAAVTAINGGVIGSGGVTFNIGGGHTENTSAAIVLTNSGTSSNQITFRKYGAGNKPLITRTDGGSITPTTIGNNADAIILIDGSDYVTFDSIDVTASNSTIEYGFYLRKDTVWDGCKNVSIKNSTITLNKGTSRFVTGICASNNSASSNNISIVSPAGRHENITLTGNVIKNTFAGIYLKGSTNFSDENIIAGGIAGGNTIQNFGGNAAYPSWGIYFSSINNSQVSYNHINNTEGGGSAFTEKGYGIYNGSSSSGSYNAEHNTISLNSGDSALYGICNTGPGTFNINNNTISGLTGNGKIFGIYQGGSSNPGKIYKNQVYDLNTNSTSNTEALVNGIAIAAGTNVYIYNNFISSLKAPYSTSIDGVRGISITSSQANSNISVYYNTIYLDGGSSGANFGSSGLYHVANSDAATSSLELRNNIIVNNSTPNGTAYSAALRRSATDLANFKTTSNNNIYYSGTPSANNVIYLGGVIKQTIEDYRQYAGPSRDSLSFSENPPFVNTAAIPYNLRIQDGYTTYCESGGKPVTLPVSITDDFDGVSRPSSPDIGADEFNGIPAFVEPPGSLTATSLSSQQVRLAFTSNSNSNNVVIVSNSTGTFTTPSGTPVEGQPMAGGTVIYTGTSSPYTHSGLTPETIAYYKAFCYNGSNYSFGITANATPTVTAPADFTSVSAGQAQINLGWTKNASSHDVIITVNSTSIAGNPVNGTQYNPGDVIPSGGTVIYNGPASSFSHSGLSAWTQYYYKCWSHDAYNYYSSGLTTDEITWADPVTAIPYVMDFSGTWVHVPAAPTAWKVVSESSPESDTWTGYTDYYYSAPACARGYSGGIADDYMISPPVVLSGAATYFSWFDKVSEASGTNSYKVLLSATNDQLSSFTTVLGDYDCNSTTWGLHSIDLSIYQGQTVFFAFYHYESASTGEVFAIDDVTVGPPPAVSTTWLGSVSTSWTSSANWSNGVPGPSYTVIISGGTYQPVISTSVTVQSVTVQAGSSVTITPTGSLNVTGVE